MEATLTSKPDANVKTHAAAPAPMPSTLPFESELGAPAGLPIFLQRSVLSWAGGDGIQLKCNDCTEEDEEKKQGVQFKLIIGAPNDAYEQEADRVADAVTTHQDEAPRIGQVPDERVQPCSACAGGEPCSECASKSNEPATVSAHDSLVQTKPLTPASTSSSLPAAIGAGSSGSPVPLTVREKVEPLLGVDLSHVQVHADSAAQVSAKRLEAKAFTHQNHIWLGPHQSADDVSLMAHELTHVVQQTGSDAPAQVIRRQPEAQSTAEDGAAVRRRLQQRIDEALGDDAPAAEQTDATANAEAANETPAPVAQDPEATRASREVDRGAVHARSAELAPDAQPDIDRAEEQQPQVEEAARSTAEELDSPPEPQAEAASGEQPPDGAEKENGGDGEGSRAGRGAIRQVASAAEQNFAAADSTPVPDIPAILTPPPEVQPVDAGGLPMPGNPAADVQAIELANDAQNLREQGHLLREYSSDEQMNAQILRGNIGLVSQGIGNSEGGVQTAQGNTSFRRGMLDQARQALNVSQEKAANVAAQAPGGVTQAAENKSRSEPMASESRDMSSENDANTPEDAEAAERAREQGGQINRASSDAANIDETITQVQGGADTLVQDAARAAQVNTQSVGTITTIDASLTQTEGRIAEMQGQNAEARGQVETVSEGPSEISGGASELGAEGQDLVQASSDIEARLHGMQQSYAERMRSVPAVAPPAEEEVTDQTEPVEVSAPALNEPVAAEAAPAEETIVQRQPEDGATAQAVEASEPEAGPVEASAPVPEAVEPSEPVQAGAPAVDEPIAEEVAPAEETLAEPTPAGDVTTPAAPAAPRPSNINIAAGLPSWLTGEAEPNAEERERAQREHETQRQQELDLITAELHGRRFEQLSAGERRRIALRLATRNMFSGIGSISWPTPGGLATGAAHLAAGLIDPRAPMMGVVSGLNMIVNATVNFARQPSWGGALRAAANIATGLTIILGSITALAGVIAALMTAITILTLGFAAPITGPIIAFCASVMSVVGTWTFWVGLIAAGLQALVFLVDLYQAGTAETAEQLQEQSQHMREDASQAGNALLQAGMGRLAAVGGRAMQAEIRAAGGGVRFAAQTGARAAAVPGRALSAIRSVSARGASRGARALGARAVAGARALPGRALSGARALGGRIASGARALPGRIVGGARALGGRIVSGARALPGRIISGARALPGRILKGARELPGRIREQLRTEFSRDFLVGGGIKPGGLRAAASETRAVVRAEVAAETRAARGATAAEAEAPRVEGGAAHVDDVSPESAAARESSVGESSHLESDQLSARQLRNEVDELADNAGLAEGAPPNRRMRMGDHEWQERPGGIWCRHSAEICVRAPSDRAVQLSESEARVQAARDRLDQGRARVEAERQRLTGPGSDVQRFESEAQAARTEAAEWRNLAEEEASAGNTVAAQEARAEAATLETRAQEAMANKTQAEQQAAHGIQGMETEARVAQAQSAATRAEQRLLTQRQMAQEIDDLERQLYNDLHGRYRHQQPPLSDRGYWDRVWDLERRRTVLADELYRARGVTDSVKLQLRGMSPPKVGSSVRAEILNDIDDTFRAGQSRGGALIDIATEQPIVGTPHLDHLCPFEDIVQMEGFNELSYAQQLRILNHPPNLIPLSGPINSSKLNRPLLDWFNTPLGRTVPLARRAELIARQGTARQELRNLIDEFLRGAR